MAAILGGEPWCFTPEQIGKLTLVQISEIYFRRRDKNGNITRDPDKVGQALSPRAAFVKEWRKWGLSKERALELWVQKRREEAVKKKEKRNANKAKGQQRRKK